MNRDLFNTWMENFDLLDENTLPFLKQIIDDFPYYLNARLLYLLNLKKLNDYRFEHELRKVAVYASDRRHLRKLITTEGISSHPVQETIISHESVSAQDDQPEALINERLKILEAKIRARLQEIEDNQARLKVLLNEKETLVSGSSQESEDGTEDGKQDLTARSLPKDDLLDEFIRDRKLNGPSTVPFFSPEESARKSIEENEGIISETLARLVAAQGKIERAIKIYEQLMLKYPQKSSYFAAQIEKLRKELKNN